MRAKGRGPHRGPRQRRRDEQHAARSRERGGAARPFPHPPGPPALHNKPSCAGRLKGRPGRLPYRRPPPGTRVHSPLSSVRSPGLPQRRPASPPQLASRRRRNGSDGGASGVGSVRVRLRRKRAQGEGRRREGRGAERPVAREMRCSRSGFSECAASFRTFWGVMDL